MKKLIILTSLCLSAGFAIALANAQDNTSSQESGSTMSRDSSTTGSSDMSSQPGSTAQSDRSEHKDMDSSQSLEAKNMKTCTDENGMTYRKGQPGFKDCMKTMHKSKSPDSMSGEAGDMSQTRTEKKSSTESSSEEK